jgi:hypothetical protein
MDKLEKSNGIMSIARPESAEPEKSRSHIIFEIIEYIPNSVVIKPIYKSGEV